MYNDLAQISKAKGIHRTLAILAILSSKPVRNENGKHSPKNQSHPADKQANVGDTGLKDERVALLR
jgi:hypothetical protein